MESNINWWISGGTDGTRPKPTCGHWVDSKGKYVAVEDMTDYHLVNTIKWLQTSGAVGLKKMRETTDMLRHLLAAPYGVVRVCDFRDYTVEKFVAEYIATWPTLISVATARGLIRKPHADEIIFVEKKCNNLSYVFDKYVSDQVDAMADGYGFAKYPGVTWDCIKK